MWLDYQFQMQIQLILPYSPNSQKQKYKRGMQRND